VAIIQLDPKHGVGERLRYRALDFNNVFFCHVLLYSFLITEPRSSPIDSKYEALHWVGQRSYAQSAQRGSHLP
jgi:hypothetical protein